MSEHDKLTEARESLERIHDYFDQRADAEAVGDPARYQGNREMYLRRDAETVAAALASARAEGAAEAYGAAVDIAMDHAEKWLGWKPRAKRLPGMACEQVAAAIRALAKEAAE